MMVLLCVVWLVFLLTHLYDTVLLLEVVIEI